jgi:hypothetical protein
MKWDELKLYRATSSHKRHELKSCKATSSHERYELKSCKATSSHESDELKLRYVKQKSPVKSMSRSQKLCKPKVSVKRMSRSCDYQNARKSKQTESTVGLYTLGRNVTQGINLIGHVTSAFVQKYVQIIQVSDRLNGGGGHEQGRNTQGTFGSVYREEFAGYMNKYSFMLGTLLAGTIYIGTKQE